MSHQSGGLARLPKYQEGAGEKRLPGATALPRRFFLSFHVSPPPPPPFSLSSLRPLPSSPESPVAVYLPRALFLRLAIAIRALDVAASPDGAGRNGGGGARRN
jgi:hypothetical protein